MCVCIYKVYVSLSKFIQNRWAPYRIPFYINSSADIHYLGTLCLNFEPCKFKFDIHIHYLPFTFYFCFKKLIIVMNDIANVHTVSFKHDFSRIDWERFISALILCALLSIALDNQESQKGIIRGRFIMEIVWSVASALNF